MAAIGGIDTSALLDLGRSLRAQGYRFITPTPATHARVNARHDNAWALNARGLLGWSRPARWGDGLDELMETMQRARVLEASGDGWRSSVRISSLGENLYFHSAYPTDADDAVFFGPDTYRFVRALLAAAPAGPVGRIVDIGCGAGAATIELALRYPDAEVIAADVNPRALQLAGVNAALAGAANLRTCLSDVLQEVDGQFDLIVSNPPYMADAAARAYRDGGDELGSALSQRIAEEATARLAPGGQLQLYTGSAIVDGRDALRERSSRWLERAGLRWSYEELDPDVFGEELEQPAYARVERIAAVLLTVHGR